MSKLLFEILSEEIPAKAQRYAFIYFKNALDKFLLSPLKVSEEDLKIFIGPRRIAFFISNLPEKKPAEAFEIKGPPKSIKEDIVQKFLAKNNKSISDLYTKVIGNSEYFFVKINSKEGAVEDFIKLAVQKILNECKWSKSMRWGNCSLKWVRPITNLLCILNEKIIPVEFHHYKANNKTFGNRILSKNKEIFIRNPDEYQDILYKNYVIIDQEKRRERIIEQIKKIENSTGLQVECDEILLEEVSSIVEWPHSILGKFSGDYMQMPERLIVKIMKHHQKLFPVCNNKGEFVNKFLVVANFNNDSVVAGYNRVVSARLEDAISMIKHDLKIDLYNTEAQLEKIIFHKNLGNIWQKVERITGLAKFIAFWIHNAPIIKIEKAANLCKSDFVTTIVKEYPELQGVMCSYYLKLHGEDDVEILDALKNYLMPINADDAIPKNPIAITLSLADKIDTLVGLIISGESIDSNKDPFGLRRNAIGIIRLILENHIDLPLKVVIEKSIDLYPSSLFKSAIIEFIKGNEEEKRPSKNKIVVIVIGFLSERFKNVLNYYYGINSKVFNAISKNLNHPLLVKKACSALVEFLKSEDAKKLISAYKRVHNILEKNKGFIEDIKVKYYQKLFIEKEELELVEIFEQIEEKLDDMLKDNNFTETYSLLMSITYPLENFMDNIKVNCEDSDVKKNRLSLLLCIIENIEKIADFKHFFDCK